LVGRDEKRQKLEHTLARKRLKQMQMWTLKQETEGQEDTEGSRTQGELTSEKSKEAGLAQAGRQQRQVFLGPANVRGKGASRKVAQAGGDSRWKGKEEGKSCTNGLREKTL